MHSITGNHRLFNEATREADMLVSEWMNETLRKKLTDDSDTDTSFLNQEFGENNQFPSLFSSITNRDVDNDKQTDNNDMNSIVKRLMSNNYVSRNDLVEHKQSTTQFSSSLLTMEARHEQVKMARKARQEKRKQEQINNMQKLEQLKTAKAILNQEEQEKLRRNRMEEVAIQQEMTKIRKMLQQRTVKEATDERDSASESQGDSEQLQKVETSYLKYESDQSSVASERDKQKQALIAKLMQTQQYQKRALIRTCFDAWFKLILNRKVAMGKAKALADWSHLIKYWHAWRKYSVIQATKHSARVHENTIKQLKVQGHLAKHKYHSFLLRKNFCAWKKYVKTQRQCKSLWEKQESTKDKMRALVTAMASVQIDHEAQTELAVESCDEDELSREDEIQHPVKIAMPDVKPHRVENQKPKAAWQLTKAHVKTLSRSDMLNMSAMGNESTRVVPMKQKTSSPQTTPHRRDNARSATLTDQKAADSYRPRVQKSSKRPKIVTAMEQRAAERTKRRIELEERKRERERIKEEELKKAEEAKTLQQEEEKRERLLSLKKEKDLKEQLAKQKLEFQARLRMLREKADAHYERALLLRCGLKPWMQFVQTLHSKSDDADRHWKRKTMDAVFNSWVIATQEVIVRKQSMADVLRKKLLIRKAFKQWLMYGEAQSILEQKADIRFRRACKKESMRRWKSFVVGQRLTAFQHEEQAASHDNRRLLKAGLGAFRRNLLDRKREERRSQYVADMRRKVASLLPDFDPLV